MLATAVVCAALVMPVVAVDLGHASPKAKPTSTRGQPQTRKTKTYSASVEKRELVLPAEAFDAAKSKFRGAERHAQGKTIEVTETNGSVVRRTEVDSPIKDATFTRTITTLKLEPTGHGKGSKRTEPAKAADPYKRPWTKRQAKFLVSDQVLGPTLDFDAGTAEVKLWWPDAEQVELHLIDSGKKLRMIPGRDGVWSVAAGAPAQLTGQRYEFILDGSRPIADPYGHAQTGDAGPSRFVDLRYRWNDQGFLPPKAPSDWVIAELHVGDETNHGSAPVPAALRGTFKGMAHPAVVKYYKDLGVNAIQLLPIMQSVEGKHWGYMTSGYFAAAERYGTPADFQHLVDEYHKAGIAVMMDVVYNHTATQAPQFGMFDGNYHYRRTADGQYANGAGVGNETATENPMVRKLILDSKRYWREHFHVDGFRDDLAAMIDRGTIRRASRLYVRSDDSLSGTPGRKAPARRPGSRKALATGEPWSADGRTQWQAGDGLPISSWDDSFREAARAFVLGHGNLDQIRTVVAGNVRPFGIGATPAATMKYIESHDEETVGDLVGPGGAARARLALGLLAITQGPVMIGQAQEIMRSKDGPPNLYDNPIRGQKKWAAIKTQATEFSFTAGMLKFRATTPYFRYNQPLTSRDVTWLTPKQGTRNTWFGFEIKAPADAVPPTGGGAWPNVIVLANSEETEWAHFDLPAGEWKVVTDGVRVDAIAGVAPAAAGDYRVPPKSLVMLMQR
ncbi:MAG: hypothetical protein IPL79_09710 [Myxococcales bacterium]|nr:hypothetical protein [Myxococcales bacterium]